jgi:hypothetical protein
MSKDLSKFLNDWLYDPEEVMVRLVPGEDSRGKIQLRIDLGVLQMELDGRPDGLRPEGHESWLEYYEHQQRQYEAAHPDSSPYLLAEEDCGRLWREAVQYYHRYLSCWHLNLYDLCARDTQRNLRLFAFVRAHTQDERHKMQFDQWRPYVLMMHARAVATPLLEQKNYESALEIIEAGIDAIREFLEEYHQSERAEECVELISLEHWREELLTREERAAESRPKSMEAILRKKLDAAVMAEEFEEAAKIRDEIRRLSGTE